MHRSTPSVVLQKQRDLLLQTPIQAGRPAFLSAASGLVCCQNHFFVVADDELHLGVFPIEPTQPGTTSPLLDGELPPNKKPRKKQKPDFEVLAFLPATATCNTPSLLVLGSGSRANRNIGLLLPLDRNDSLQNKMPQPFDLSDLYRELELEFGIVNIEGAAIRGDQLILLQRGNKKPGVNAIISLDLSMSVTAMLSGAMNANALRSIQPIDLGSHAGVAVGFTDALCLPNGQLLALAVAEDTDDPYADGKVSASYLCRFDSCNQLQTMIPLNAPAKTEGLALWCQLSSSRQSSSAPSLDSTLAFVTDADDPTIPAALLTAPLRAFM